MKRAIVKLGKTGKIIAAIFGFIIAAFGVWGIYKKCTTEDITGGWYLEFKVEKSAYKPFIGETHTQKVEFEQKDDIVTGNGEKWKYNGEYLPADMHRLVEYDGKVDGNSFTAKYILHGQKRVSIGRIVVKIIGNKMEGTFSGTAGESSGTVIGERIN